MASMSDFVRDNLDSIDFERISKHFGNKVITVTGGASFIGSNLVDVLLDIGARVRVIDDFSSGKREHLQSHPNLELVEADLKLKDQVDRALVGSAVLFHLAAVHGGRGFIETQQSAMLANFAIDYNVFSRALTANIGMIVHASSACAYPLDLQESESELNFLREEQASMEEASTSFPDGVYGWTKLGGEYQLETIVKGTGTKGRSARIFTAYGERENESHAAIALAAKALLHADPYPIWGSGQQTRNFTYVGDTVTGLLLLGSDSRDVEFDVFNVGTSDHVKVIDFVREIFTAIQWEPQELDLQLDKPVGVASRASDNSKMMTAFNWAPGTSIQEGIRRTLSWYSDLPDRPMSLADLEQKLMTR
jgi:nucleoside-diphosphate-sugar epimerase